MKKPTLALAAALALIATGLAVRAQNYPQQPIRFILAFGPGGGTDTVISDMERDYWMNAEEAVRYGIVSRVVQRQAELS